MILYYTCNTHPLDIELACRNRLRKASDEPIMSVSLNEEIEFGDIRFVLEGKKGNTMLHNQILFGLQRIANDETVFLCESDVLYHSSHFDHVLDQNNVFYYNTNVWKVRYDDGLSVWTDDMIQVSGLCASQSVLLEYYTQKVLQMEQQGFNRHYEPGIKQSVGSSLVQTRKSLYPNLCIRHDKTMTKSKWSPEDFRNPQYARGWRTSDNVEGWGDTKAVMNEVKLWKFL